MAGGLYGVSKYHINGLRVKMLSHLQPKVYTEFFPAKNMLL